MIKILNKYEKIINQNLFMHLIMMILKKKNDLLFIKSLDI